MKVEVTVTFLPAEPSAVITHTVAAAGIVRLPWGDDRRFDGWMELIAILEEAAQAVTPLDAANLDVKGPAT